MSVTASNAAVSAAMAAQASAEASRAHEERCKLEVLAYQPKTANVAQMQSYAACVRTLYPTESDNEGMKWIVGILLAATILGGVIGVVRQSWDWVDGLVMGGMQGFLLAGLGLLLLSAVLFLVS